MQRARWRLIPKSRTISQQPLREWDIWEVVEPYENKPLTSNKDLREDMDHFGFVNERSIPRTGKVEYCLGEPGGANSMTLVTADNLHNRSFFRAGLIVMITALISAPISVAIGGLVALLCRKCPSRMGSTGAI